MTFFCSRPARARHLLSVLLLLSLGMSPPSLLAQDTAAQAEPSTSEGANASEPAPSEPGTSEPGASEPAPPEPADQPAAHTATSSSEPGAESTTPQSESAAGLGLDGVPSAEPSEQASSSQPHDSNADGGESEGVETDDEETPPEGERFFDPDATRWALGLGVHVTAADEGTWDEALRTRGYGQPGAPFGLDLLGLYQITNWFSLGGHVDFRHRGWAHQELADAGFFGLSLMVEARAEIPLRKIQPGVFVAGGLGLGWTSVNETASVNAVGRFQAGAFARFVVYGPLGINVRFAYDHYQLSPDTAGRYDLNLGGFLFGFGLEVRE